MSVRILLLSAMLSVCTLALAGDAEDLQRLDKERTVATWTGDALWFQQNLADDFLLTTPTGAVRTKRDVIAELATPGLRMEPYDPIEVQVRIFTDTAVVHGRVLQRFTVGRARYSNDVRYTDVYVRKKNRWLLVSGHASDVARRR